MRDYSPPPPSRRGRKAPWVREIVERLKAEDDGEWHYLTTVATHSRASGVVRTFKEKGVDAVERTNEAGENEVWGCWKGMGPWREHP